MVFHKYSDHIRGHSKSQKTKVEDKENDVPTSNRSYQQREKFLMQILKAYHNDYFLPALSLNALLS